MPLWNGRQQLQRRMTDPLNTLNPTLTLPYANSSAPRAYTNTLLMPWSSHLSMTSNPSTRRWYIPSLRRIEQSARRVGRRRQGLMTCLFILGMALSCLLLVRHIHRRGDKYTLVFDRANLQQIWRWEVASGHHPSEAPVPKPIGLSAAILNPTLSSKPSHSRRPQTIITPGGLRTHAGGPKRFYLDIPDSVTNIAHPSRPIAGSVADLDIINSYCDFDTHKYVRDCLEVLRVAGGLDNGHRLRLGDLDKWKYLYLEDHRGNGALPLDTGNTHAPVAPDGQGLRKRRGAVWEAPLSLPAPHTPKPFAALPSPCDDDYPRIFHMFWTGPFTDKPYTALLSFLYTQNTGIHLPKHHETNVCRPKFWFWISPGPAASVPNPSAYMDMFDELKNNPWSAPFLHPRFQDIIYFKLWNVTDQLDNTPELKDEWRSFPTLFNSGGHKFEAPKSNHNGTALFAATQTNKGDIYNRVGSKSADTVDKLSTIMSDIARFLLCHRYGGVYLDVDNLLLRDWEELWGWKGAFAYRWSWHTDYNTAILRLNKQSALGTFLFRTALKNDLNFHPMTITKYLNDAHLQDLLFRVPDALFDPAFLSVEKYQRERPPLPAFSLFHEFFDTPVQNSAAPSAMGFDGFFKGAYCYHWHNSYWTPFDHARNWPDLGRRFSPPAAAKASVNSDEDLPDLNWSAVMKRTFEAYIRGERPNMYGEWIQW